MSISNSLLRLQNLKGKPKKPIINVNQRFENFDKELKDLVSETGGDEYYAYTPNLFQNRYSIKKNKSMLTLSIDPNDSASFQKLCEVKKSNFEAKNLTITPKINLLTNCKSMSNIMTPVNYFPQSLLRPQNMVKKRESIKYRDFFECFRNQHQILTRIEMNTCEIKGELTVSTIDICGYLKRICRIPKLPQ